MFVLSIKLEMLFAENYFVLVVVGSFLKSQKLKLRCDERFTHAFTVNAGSTTMLNLAEFFQ